MPVAPWPIDKAPGEAESEKLGEWTARLKRVVCVNEPEVPVIVTGVVPGVALLAADSVSTLELVVGLALHDAVTPLGSVLVTARVTLPVNPPALVIERVVEPDAPRLTFKVPDEGAIQKPGTCGPARASMRFCPCALPQPVVRSYPPVALNHTG